MPVALIQPFSIEDTSLQLTVNDKREEGLRKVLGISGKLALRINEFENNSCNYYH